MLSAFDVLNFMPRQRIKKMLTFAPSVSECLFSLSPFIKQSHHFQGTTGHVLLYRN